MFCCVCSIALWRLGRCWRSTWTFAIIEAIEFDIGHFRPAFARSHGHQHDVIHRIGIGRIGLAAGTRGGFRSFIAGFVATVALQSSTATALMVASFVEKDLIVPAMAQVVLLGANVGTATTAWIVALGLGWLSPLLILAGVVLSLTVHPWWIALTAFAGLNMLQASFTGFCPAAMVFKAFGVRPGTAFK